MRRRSPILLAFVFLLVAATAFAASNPIPGVGVVIKRNPGSSSALVIPADFFGTGSSPFSGTVLLEGRCTHLGPTHTEECDDGDSRYDFVTTSSSSLLDVSMPSLSLYSIAPITVDVSGTPLTVDVVITLSSQNPAPFARITGQLELSPGAVLDLGSSSFVQACSLDMLATITFVDAATGTAVGGSLQEPLHFSLSAPGTPITRLDDGTALGRIVLGGPQTNPAFVNNKGTGSMPSSELYFSSQPPPPPVPASGLLCSSAGVATIAPSTDSRRLPVRNIGSSGEDGVDITLSKLHGHSMSSSSLWSPLDDGATISFDWSCSLNGLPPGEPVIGTLSLRKGYDYYQARCDLSAFSSSTEMRCLAYSGSSLVFDSPCPSSVLVDIQCGTGSSLVPATTFELDNSARFVFASVSSSNSVLLFGGQSVACDRVVFVADLDQDGFTDVCRVRAAAPPASSLHDLDFDSQATFRLGRMAVEDALEDCDDEHVVITPLSSSSSSVVRFSSSLSSMVKGEVCDDGRCVSGGGGGAGGSSRVSSLPLNGVLYQSTASSFVLDRRTPFHVDATDPASDGLSLTTRVLGTGGCSPTGELASLRLLASSGSLSLSSSFSSMCADQESVIVKRRGVQVARVALALDGSVLVFSPPGGPSLAAVSGGGKAATKSSSNIQNNLGTPGAPTSSSVVDADGLALHMEFVFDRMFCVNGQCFTGDDIVFKGSCSSGQCGTSSLVTTSSEVELSRTGGSWPPSSSLSLLGAPPAGGDVIRAVLASSVSISSTTPVVHIPVMFDRSSSTAARGASVTLQLSTGIVPVGPFVEGDYFSGSGPTQFFVVDNGGGSYTVDCALLGGGCGPTDSGQLFSLSVARAPGAPDGVATVSITASEAADCNAGPLPASPGGAVFIIMDSSTPAAITGLQATQVTTGNDNDGTTKVALVWSPRSNVSVELYRTSFGNYPEYDDAPNAGSVPSPPSYPPSGRWSPVSLVCSSNGALGSSCTDEPSSRDFYYYAAFARDAFGNVSPVSSLTSGTLNYHLGDVSNGSVSCAGDNLDSSPDISYLGSHYGVPVPSGSSFACLDVGPTSTGTVSGRPLTDNRISFADLILFAVNYSLVSSPGDREQPLPAPANALSLRVPALPASGGTFAVDVDLEGAGDLQGLSAQLAWDAAVVEPVGIAAAELLAAQGREGVVLSAQPGNVDAALLGAGQGFAGRGTLARATFRVRGSGDPAIRVASVQGRDAANREVAIANASGAAGLTGRTALRLAFPNPFERATTVVFTLAKSGPAEVGVFDVAGRHVRTLLTGTQAAGEHALQWDGRDDSGQRVNAGMYMLRLEAAGHRETRSLRLVR